MFRRFLLKFLVSTPTEKLTMSHFKHLAIPAWRSSRSIKSLRSAHGYHRSRRCRALHLQESPMAKPAAHFLTSLALASGFALACVPVPAVSAQGFIRVQAPPMRLACRPDCMRYCRGVPFGGGRVLRCLNGHVDQLSQPCFQALALRGLATAGALRICSRDYERLCPGVPLERDRAIACLLERVPELSPVCLDAFQRNGLLDDEEAGPPPK